jgi:phosphatidyl-myo-inositol alpha-mannosyltransferase
VHWLANALIGLGEEVTCYSMSPRPQDALYGHVKLTYHRESAFVKKLSPAIRFRMIDKRGYDILHYHGDDFLCAGGRRRIRTLYGSAFWEARFALRPGRFFYQAAFYGFEWVSCLRRGALVGISRVTAGPLPLVRTFIPCGVPLDRFRPGDVKTPEPSIMFIGDLDSRKRGRMLVETFEAAIRPSYPRATLTIVGPERAEGAGVRFAGRLDEGSLIDAYRKSWVYCSVSSYEGFGVPLIEAMACGTAVIAVGNSGAREIVTDGFDGLLCSEEQLGGTLLRLLSEKSLRQTLARNGLCTAQRYDIRAVAGRYADIYRARCHPRAGRGHGK